MARDYTISSGKVLSLTGDEIGRQEEDGSITWFMQVNTPAGAERPDPVTASRSVTGNIEFSGGESTLVLPVGTADLSSAPHPEDKGALRWVIGDLTVAEALAISGTSSSYPIDMRNVNFGNGTLMVKVTGSGTVKATLYGSMDGITNPVSLGDILTGMTAATGTYVLDLATLNPFPFYKMVFTETGGVSTAGVQAVIFATDASTSQAMPRTNLRPYIVGDETFISTIAAGVAQRCAPLDLRHIDRATSKLLIEVTGSGTCKLSAEGGDSIQTLTHSLGDVKTGMTAGTHTVNLTDSALRYFPYLVFTVTETSGASDINVRIGINARMLSRVAEKPAVLVLLTTYGTRGNQWTVVNDAATMTAINTLEAMGYRVDKRAISEVDSTFADSIGAAYVAVVIPSAVGLITQEWVSGAGRAPSRFCKGKSPIPVFAVGVYGTIDARKTNIFGCDSYIEGGFQKIIWNGAPWYRNCESYTVTAKPHMTSLDILATAQTGGGAVMWRFKGEAGWVYCASGTVQSGECTLPHLMASAIAAGHMPAPPKKLRAVIDIDDIPDTENGGGVISTISDLERVYAVMQRLRMPSTWGIQAHAMHKVPTPLFDFIKSRTVKAGGLIYPINHDSSGTWVSKSKAEQDAWFRTGCATMASYGIPSGRNADGLDMWGYMYFNNNAFNEDTIALASPEFGIHASPDHALQKTGYGWKVARSYSQGSGLNTRPIGQNNNSVQNLQMHRGVLIVGSDGVDMPRDTDLTDETISGVPMTKAAINCNKLLVSATRDMPIYAHGDQCFDHDGYNAPTTMWLEVVAANQEAGLSNVLEFVHGSALAGI